MHEPEREVPRMVDVAKHLVVVLRDDEKPRHELQPSTSHNLTRSSVRCEDLKTCVFVRWENGDRGLAQNLATEAIDMQLPARSRPSVLRELVSLAERTGMVYHRTEIVEALEAREALASTALPGGIAFPHPRQPLAYATAEPMLCLARPR